MIPKVEHKEPPKKTKEELIEEAREECEAENPEMMETNPHFCDAVDVH